MAKKIKLANLSRYRSIFILVDFSPTIRDHSDIASAKFSCLTILRSLLSKFIVKTMP